MILHFVQDDRIVGWGIPNNYRPSNPEPVLPTTDYRLRAAGYTPGIWSKLTISPIFATSIAD